MVNNGLDILVVVHRKLCPCITDRHSIANHHLVEKRGKAKKISR